MIRIIFCALHHRKSSKCIENDIPRNTKITYLTIIMNQSRWMTNYKQLVHNCATKIVKDLQSMYVPIFMVPAIIFLHNVTSMTDRYMILVSLPMISGARYQIKFSNSVFQPYWNMAAIKAEESHLLSLLHLYHI